MGEIGYIDASGLHLYDDIFKDQYGSSFVGTSGMTIKEVLADPLKYQEKTKLSYDWSLSNVAENFPKQLDSFFGNIDDKMTKYAIIGAVGLIALAVLK